MATHDSRATTRKTDAHPDPSGTRPSATARHHDVDPARLHADALLRNEQVAAILGCPVSTFYALRKRLGREFPRPVMIGCRIRWRWGTMQKWIRDREAAAGERG